MYISNTTIYFKNINLEINKITKEISSNKKELNANEFGISLSLTDNLRKFNFIKSNIEKNLTNRSSNDLSFQNIKKDLESINIELLKINNDTNSNDLKNIIKKNIEQYKISLNKNEFQKDNLLVGINEYINTGFKTNDVLDPINNYLDNLLNNIDNNIDITSSIDDFNNIYNEINIKHSQLGSEHFIIDNKYQINNKKIEIYQENKMNIEDVNLVDSYVNLKNLENTYNALATTISKVNNLSLVNFIN